MILIYQNETYLKIGTLGKINGFKGLLNFYKSIDEVEELVFDKKISLFIKSSLEIEKIEDYKIVVHGDNFLISINNVNSIEDAKKIINSDIFIKRKDLQIEIIPDDLINFQVIDSDQNTIGNVVDIGNYGSGTLLEIIKKDKTTFMIPFIKTDMEFDLKNKLIILNEYQSE